MAEAVASDRTVSLDEAISIAIQLQQSEQWVAAGAIYRTILEVVPDHPEAVHYSGVLAHQEGRSGEAVELIERSLSLEPGRADWHSNLAIVLRDRLELDKAIASCRRAIALDATHANAHNNLGVLLRAQGRMIEAEAAYRAAIRARPDHSDAYTNLGVLLNGQKRTHEAAVCFCKVIFTVEELSGGAPGAGYTISPHGRYSHARQYVERVLLEANLQPEITAAELRLEAGEPVPGLVVSGMKSSSQLSVIGSR